MAKLGGNKKGLFDFREQFSLSQKGKIYDLSRNLIFQQSMTFPSKSLDEDNFSVVLGSVSSTNFTPSIDFSSTMQGLKFTSNSGNKVELPTLLGQYVGFTTSELTISLWFSGSSAATGIGETTPYILQVSGTNGIQAHIAKMKDDSPELYTNVIFAVSSSGTPSETSTIVASTLKTAGKTIFQNGAYNRGFYGRFHELIDIPTSPENIRNNIDLDENKWHHLVYQQIAARDPDDGTYNSVLAKTVSPTLNTSKTGKEGLCQVWLDGELVYETPAYGPFPRGHSSFFYEDGLKSSTSPNGSRYTSDNPIKNKTLKQSSPTTTLWGGGSDGIAQLAIWNRVLSAEEIKAIYEGSISGIYSTPITSFSSAPKKFIDTGLRTYNSPSISIGSGNSFENDNSPFSESDDNSFSFQENVQINDDIFSEMTFLDETNKLQIGKNQLFSDEENLTSLVYDPEYIIPSGSSIIRIDISNTDENAVAVRYHKSSNNVLQQLVPSSSGLSGTGFMYYSPVLKRWVEKTHNAATSFSSDYEDGEDPGNSHNVVTSSARLSPTALFNLIREPYFQANKIMSQFAWSPQFGYFLNHVEHLKQAGYERIGWPTSVFGAPNAPKYHGFDHETIKLSNYINAPFILKRIEIKIPVEATRRFGANPRFRDVLADPYNTTDGSVLYGAVGDGSGGSSSGELWERQITNKKDIDNFVFFLYRQRRVSRNRDQREDWSTSKRYLIGSASVCFYNSSSFGGAWKDDFIEGASSKWQSLNSSAGYNSSSLLNSLAYPGDTTDFYGKTITQISGNNCILHNPQYSHNWEVGRFVTNNSSDNITSYVTKSEYLNLIIQPHSVPSTQVAPSLIPITSSNVINFDLRENDDRRTTYTNFGSREDVTDNSIPAPALTLVSNRWTGGTRPPQFASSHTNDPYDTIRAPGDAYSSYANGTVDVTAPLAQSFVQLTIISSSLSGSLQSLSYAPPIGQVQSMGIAMFPTSKDDMIVGNKSLIESDFTYQQPIDPSSVNSSYPAGKINNIRWYGRRALTESPARGAPGAATADGVCHVSEHADEDKNYVGYYGWRFISAFQSTDFSDTQTYNPVILDPHDELILGLDAGTFGPPDLDVDDLPGDGQGPLTGEAPDGSLAGSEAGGGLRAYKNTVLKEDYNLTLSDSHLRILMGKAEIVLIGDFVSNDRAVLPFNRTSTEGNARSAYGMEPVVDRFINFNAELLSGSMLTRVFTGTPGPQGLIDGDREFIEDAGARRI